ncbi:lytic murein transglycosylase B [Halomonas sp. GXIMD04776]|uniref:lytic murein transglycosylase B n=1 Tax=Halomonas sp. GXIMD04776 TaxID=3415605 RepID=UPI003C88EEAD
MKAVLRQTLGALLATAMFASPAAQAAEDFDPAHNPKTQALVDELVSRGGDRDWLELALRQAEFRPAVLEAMTGAAERRLVWHEYRDIFIKPQRIEEGAAFIQAHQEAFDKAQAEYGVAPEVIAAIIGVETFYGRHTGTHRVIDSLATLAFHHPKRGDFFRGELAAFLEITSEQNVDPLTLEGSYAGAMGFPQFIPTSYQAYAVDFDGDGKRDLWHNPVDAIGSVGNYFARHGWKTDGAIVTEAKGPKTPPKAVNFNRTQKPYVSVGDLRGEGVEPTAGAVLEDSDQVIPLSLETRDGSMRYLLGHDNFYVITRYNHSHLYAMAVTTLAQRIRDVLESEV